MRNIFNKNLRYFFKKINISAGVLSSIESYTSFEKAKIPFQKIYILLSRNQCSTLTFWLTSPWAIATYLPYHKKIEPRLTVGCPSSSLAQGIFSFSFFFGLDIMKVMYFFLCVFVKNPYV